MKIRLFAIAASALVLSAAAPAQPAAGLQGEWRNTKNTVHMKLAPCGKSLCGTVTWAAEQQRADARKGSGRDLIGSVLLRDLQKGSDGTWRGKVFVPDINTSASGTVTQLSGDLIRVSGCTLLGIVCKTQHWHRIK
ncbi:DUF2147 domain-containing protein [Sphingomonas sp. G-3-2-10]|uniref:DUF2147 domain-containing protein n=1 Tax=Sphingomonas sp. G-3-2-10 TaxID=2728838 RepID=UPI00146F5527|nr:DUF2147 domain-containing protein [Sphingomonas sp. G-3-2-10]NML07587.1 DUF2147 domain-containing protein [Sphingomonas sp. G-3-2-10]